jgi:3-hydroxyisobutyrate dehydrogenase-like beta-hydroxyacid dehydrogenase
MPSTVAVLSAGEMGSRVGRILREDGGHRVLTWIEGRGEATRRRAESAGLECLPSLDDVVCQAQLVVSVVPPSAAEPLARSVADAVRRVGTAPLYLDANSIGPSTAVAIGRAVEASGGVFVDGAIIGGATGLPARGLFVLSGADAPRVSDLLQPALKTQILGSDPGQASAFKVLYAGLTKGLSALGVELLAAAQRVGLADALLQRYGVDHASVVDFWVHTLPGLPRRAWRRAQEMEELQALMGELGLGSHMAAAARATLDDLAARQGTDGPPDWDDLRGLMGWLAAG